MFSLILLDVGGTTIKGSASISSIILPPIIVVPSLSSQSKGEIINNLYSTIIEIKEKSKIDYIDGVAFGFPGPFDYKRGISYIKGVGKYDALYGLDIEAAIKERDKEGLLTNSTFLFLNDIEAFALGAMEENKELGKGKTLFLALGTGTGSAFSIDGELRKEGEGIPENGWIYSLPYKESIIDDYISKRGLEKISKEITGKVLDGSTLNVLASYGNREAEEVFKVFGETIGEALSPVIKDFKPRGVVIGGNIAKAGEFFLQSLEAVIDTPVLFINDTSLSTFTGLEKTMRNIYGI